MLVYTNQRNDSADENLGKYVAPNLSGHPMDI